MTFVDIDKAKEDMKYRTQITQESGLIHILEHDHLPHDEENSYGTVVTADIVAEVIGTKKPQALLNKLVQKGVAIEFVNVNQKAYVLNSRLCKFCYMDTSE